MTYADAYKRWYKCHVGDFDKTIYDIIDGLIKDNGGLDVLINRNPSINLGSLLYTKCIGINLNYTMSLSLLVLKPLQADFDKYVYITLSRILVIICDNSFELLETPKALLPNRC